jgi:hypothetical protein
MTEPSLLNAIVAIMTKRLQVSQSSPEGNGASWRDMLRHQVDYSAGEPFPISRLRQMATSSISQNGQLSGWQSEAVFPFPFWKGGGGL